MKHLWKILITLTVVTLIFTLATYCANAGRLTRKAIDLNVLNSDNPISREREIESCAVATVSVLGFDDYAIAGVTVGFEDKPDIRASVFLSDADAAKLNIGDIIIVKGRINYMESNSGMKYIVIGSAIAVPPYSFNAKLIDILSNSDTKKHFGG